MCRIITFCHYDWKLLRCAEDATSPLYTNQALALWKQSNTYVSECLLGRLVSAYFYVCKCLLVSVYSL
jgi:hypothetical protein